MADSQTLDIRARVVEKRLPGSNRAHHHQRVLDMTAAPQTTERLDQQLDVFSSVESSDIQEIPSRDAQTRPNRRRAVSLRGRSYGTEARVDPQRDHV
jgi:hypothetical protein